jgi:hypothetical protein
MVVTSLQQGQVERLMSTLNGRKNTFRLGASRVKYSTTNRVRASVQACTPSRLTYVCMSIRPGGKSSSDQVEAVYSITPLPCT